MKSNNFIKRAVHKSFKDNLVMTLRFSAIISFVLLILYCICAITLSAVGSFSLGLFGTLVLGLLFVILFCYLLEPFLYSYFAMTVLLNSPSRDDVRMSGYFKTLQIGFNKPVLKSLSLPTTLIYSLLIFLGLDFVCTFASYVILYNSSETYKQLFDNLFNLYQAGNYDDFNTYINSNIDNLRNFLLVTQFIASLGSFYFFLHRTSIYIMRYFLVPFSNNLPNVFSTTCFKETIRTNKKYFYGNYYSIVWIYIPIILIVYSASFFLIYYLNLQNSNFIIIELSSIVITLLFLLPFAPLLFNLYVMMVDKFGAMYTSVINGRLFDQIKTLKSNYSDLSKEDQERLDYILKQRPDFKKMYDSFDANKKDAKDDDSKISKDDNADSAKKDDVKDDNDEHKEK